MIAPRTTSQWQCRSREEEADLWSRWRNGKDVRARDLLVRANLRYVAAIACKYRRYGIPLAELVAEGNFGVAHALTKFEPERGNRFVTYAAYWIRAMILDYIVRSWSLVGKGSGAFRSKMFFRLRRERVRVTNLMGEGEGAEEVLAMRFNISRERLIEMLTRLEARDVSLDAKVHDDSVASRLDTLVSPGATPEEVCARDQLKRRVIPIVHDALNSLDQRERYILERRTMADADEVHTLAEIGLRFGISRERARQLEERAKRKFRRRILECSSGREIEEMSRSFAA